MISFLNEYRIPIMTACIIIMIILSLYYYINSSKKQWYQYYWKGFVLILAGYILYLLSLALMLPKPYELIRKILSLLLVVYGFWLIVLGGKRKKRGEMGDVQ